MAKPIKQTVVDFSAELAAEWSENNTEKPSEVSIASTKKYLWVSSCGHEWLMSPSRRRAGTTCTYCSGRALLPGFNDLATTDPLVAEQWHPTKNGGLKPTDVSRGSRKRVWWQCARGHYWDSPVKNRTILGRGCAVCSGLKVWAGENDLQTLYPLIAEEFHPKMNGELTASTVTSMSDREVWWLGKCGHEWKMRVSARTFAGNSCPFCSGKQVLVGYNDLATTHPQLAKEFHPTKNYPLTVEQVTAGSSARIWWLGECGHEWDTRACDRTRGRFCPECAQMGASSKAEDELAEYVESILPVGSHIVRNQRTIVKPLELDIYLPEKSIAIEFNGIYWHSDRFGKGPEDHYLKWKQCQDKGVQLITVWEDDWRNKKSIIQTMLAHKLGVSSLPTIGARRCQVQKLGKQEIEVFMNENHIQGFVPGSYYVGLVAKETKNIVAAMILRKEREGELILSRYATSCRVPGGQSKLLAWIDNNVDYTTMVTFADHEVSNGLLYESTGWTKDKELPPDYKYVYAGRRVHKFNFRIKRFREDNSLIYEEGKTESELALMNSIPRVWDSGKTRFTRDR